MCGILGVKGVGVAELILNGLVSLQHRGQDAAGMAVVDEEGVINCKKNLGKVADVFKKLFPFESSIGIGHVRYPTAGSYKKEECQPFTSKKVAISHNGNLVNYQEIRRELEMLSMDIKTGSDSELFLHFITYHLKDKDIFQIITLINRKFVGSYSVVVMIGDTLVAFRDPHGIRPLCYGYTNDKFAIASESVALDILDIPLINDIKAGTAMLIDGDDIIIKQCHPFPKLTPCIFEYVYLARPDSVIDGVNVYQSRRNMGKVLGERIIGENLLEEEIDVIMPVPNTSRPATIELANTLGIPYREGFVKNVYIDRTFITSNQGIRKRLLKRKLNTINQEFEGKNVMIVDDSIVRGNTSKHIIRLARKAGAKTIYFVSCSPQIRYPNVYGIDMPTQKELIAFKKTDKEIAEEIGADKMIYQTLEDLIKSVTIENCSLKQFECSVFNGVYLTKMDDYLEKVKVDRDDSMKTNLIS